ncbi:hypothetical protein SJ_217 [Proteus phage SJ_PmiM]|nr:hypothetical protein SJ_217 [Proteus phage SJ_PmiM]
MTHLPHPFKMEKEGRLLSLSHHEAIKETNSYPDVKPIKFLEHKVVYTYKTKSGKKKDAECILWVKWIKD